MPMILPVTEQLLHRIDSADYEKAVEVCLEKIELGIDRGKDL